MHTAAVEVGVGLVGVGVGVVTVGVGLGDVVVGDGLGLVGDGLGDVAVGDGLGDGPLDSPVHSTRYVPDGQEGGVTTDTRLNVLLLPVPAQA